MAELALGPQEGEVEVVRLGLELVLEVVEEEELRLVEEVEGGLSGEGEEVEASSLPVALKQCSDVDQHLRCLAGQ